MPSNSWDLALTEIIYYIPATIPTLYCLWRHRENGFGWFFFFIFISLQVVGSGMTLSAGQNGTPSTIAITITSVGLSPLMLGIAGVIHEWAKVCGVLKTEKSRKMAWVFVLLYHIAVAGAIAIYAVGSSDASDPAKAKSGSTLAKAGIVLLLALYFVLHGVLGLAAKRLRPSLPCAVLFWSVVASLVLLGIRLMYSTVATFNGRKGVYNPVTGSIALRVVFEFLPGALVLLVMVVGGIMSLSYLEDQKYQAETSQSGRRGKQGELA